MGEEIKIVLMAIAVIFVGYIAIRLWSYGAFRSYFDAQKQHNKPKTKED